jgi:fumarate hydratase subunit beta
VTLFRLTVPLGQSAVEALRAGDRVLLSGTLYTARDAAHQRMVAALQQDEVLPIPLEGQVLYFAGPTPAPPGRVIGSIGPTTASRMDAYSPLLIERGLKGMIGKGSRSAAVVRSLQAHGCVYFGAVEGTAALLSSRIQAADVVAYPDLGPEAIHRLLVTEFPVIVVNDCFGGDLYQAGRQRYARRGASGAA